jgi:hypothetical protein
MNKIFFQQQHNEQIIRDNSHFKSAVCQQDGDWKAWTVLKRLSPAQLGPSLCLCEEKGWFNGWWVWQDRTGC